MLEPKREYTGADGDSGAVSERVREFGRRAAEAASEVGRRAREIRGGASATLWEAKQRVGVTADRAVGAYRGARAYAQANPGVAAAVTFAAGVGVGMMAAARKTR